jgi:NNP family nitrate/nitrite transporter-like MFS transporter
MATAYWDDERVKDRDGFWHLGHRPTLIAAFLYFDLAFMVWVLLGPLAPEIAKTLGLTAAQKGLMVATPTLAGACCASSTACWSIASGRSARARSARSS